MRQFPKPPPRPLQIVGFTGSREGMTVKQEDSLRKFLGTHVVVVFHHGDCVGADARAHAIVSALQPRARIIIHPPTESRLRANCKGAHLICPPAPYLERNRAIVDASEIIVAAPQNAAEEQRSGTWATVRYARQIGKPVIVLNPDGTRTGERVSLPFVG